MLKKSRQNPDEYGDESCREPHKFDFIARSQSPWDLMPIRYSSVKVIVFPLLEHTSLRLPSRRLDGQFIFLEFLPIIVPNSAFKFVFSRPQEIPRCLGGKFPYHGGPGKAATAKLPSCKPSPPSYRWP
jgi:hypothetical protein